MLVLDLTSDLYALVIYIWNKFAYPPEAIPMSAQLIVILIVVLIGLLPMSLPLIHYAFKLRGFVKYSEMWQPWKKLAAGWLMLIIGAISGIIVLSYVIFSGMAAKPYITVVFFMIALSPMIICMVITIILTFIGIKEFHGNAKKVVEAL
jgi:hypothetical protein